jgi:hypothetical protein
VNFLRINNLILFPYYNDQISKQPLLDFQSDLEKNNLSISVVPVDIPEIIELEEKVEFLTVSLGKILQKPTSTCCLEDCFFDFI